MNTKKIVVLAVSAVVLFYIITDPTGAAGAVQSILGWLKDGASAVITFIKGIFS